MISDTSTYTDFQGFTALRNEAKGQSPEVIKKVAKQFESLFVQMMLKSMRDTMPEDGLFNSKQQRMYQDMYDKQISLNIASGKGIGLAAVIERQLGGQSTEPFTEKTMSDYLAHPVVTQKIVAQVSAIDHPYTEQSRSLNENNLLWDDQQSFIHDIWPHAVKAADELGVEPEVLMAQSALETGWGQHVRQFENGDNSFSLFGIKADQRWQGKAITVATLEFKDGAMQREKAQFRAYDSIGEAFNDYVDFIQSNPRYQQALEKGFNPVDYARELQQAGYATDPDYARKIERIRNSDLLKTQVSELKNTRELPII
ncbi:MAG: flagellar assembly peptidoglycan hydrolase FlgJ [Gammaproteobacteria bacterium]|nr:flagellar assembly peptidoglycan hydrolase FlgJ [Gammaproteobacteria bacterium]